MKMNKIECPKWEDIHEKIFVYFIVIFLTTVFFARANSDIQEYISDHNISFKLLNFIVFLGFFIFFYALPRLAIDALKLISLIKSDNEIDEKVTHYYLLSFIFIVFYISLILTYLVPWLAPNEGGERDALWNTMLIWLLSILAINFLFTVDVFKEWLSKPVSKKLVSKIKKR
jgi:uncharacterized membrane protein YbhN (UPF0104 family)